MAAEEAAAIMNSLPTIAEAELSDHESEEGLGDDAKATKRKERLEQNRISARESRKRKKTMIEELQRTVITLSRENKDLNDRNENLRSQLMEIGTKVSGRLLCYMMLCYMMIYDVMIQVRGND
jgi:predicted RNase H-like nuclease (RuvC/YqgF family)